MKLQIPITTHPNQVMQVLLGDVSYTLKLMYNHRAQCWFISIYDENKQPLALGAPLIMGVDFMQQRIFSGYLYLVNNTGKTAEPTLENLHSDFSLIWDDGDDS